MAHDPITIAVDFDGTIVSHDYPHIGYDLGAVPLLKELQSKGHRLILYTMRHDQLLQKAVEWCAQRGLKFNHINSNPAQKEWTTSPKIYADIYIDDAAIGCPIKFIDGVRRPVVDWDKVRRLLEDEGVL